MFYAFDTLNDDQLGLIDSATKRIGTVLVIESVLRSATRAIVDGKTIDDIVEDDTLFQTLYDDMVGIEDAWAEERCDPYL
mgnify:FL=1